MPKDKLRVLQIGAGSMGTRRMRDLSEFDDVEVILYDERKDRRERAAGRFKINVCSKIEEALEYKPDALVISTPPDRHAQYVELALERGLHSFCEGNIWTYDYGKVKSISGSKGIVTVASSSLMFLPVVRGIKRIADGELGQLHSYSMCLSTYEPGWHPGEGEEYYARRRSTSAAREMVPFELGYLNHVFGRPEYVSGLVDKRGELKNTREDIWSLQMKLENGAAGQLSVFMACPAVVRRGWFAGTYGFAEFDIMAGTVNVNVPEKGINETISFGEAKDVLEKAYKDEISAFIESIKGKECRQYTYEMSAAATAALAAAERSSISGRTERVDLLLQPALYPDEY